MIGTYTFLLTLLCNFSRDKVITVSWKPFHQIVQYKMGSLTGGVLLKLMEEMDTNRNSSDEYLKQPVLLQIRSIIPILKDGNLWPNQGFYLRVADATHAIYASLPQDQHDMILNDKLQLGQYIYVQRLEKSYPFPVLVGLTPIPGRHFCVGRPKDLLKNNILRFGSNFVLDAECNIDVEKKVRGKYRSVSPSTTRSLVRNKSSVRKARKRNPRSGEDDSDSDCSNLSTVSSVSKISRRNWKSSDLSSIKEITEATLVRHKTKSPIWNRSAWVSPSHFAAYNDSDEKSCNKSERKIIDQNPRLAKSPTKSDDTLSDKHQVSVNSISLSIPSKDEVPGDICWDAIPSALSKAGKEVLRQRDLALLAAAEALQEAAAAERLLKSLRMFSSFQSINQDDDAQPSVDSFLKLTKNLAQTRLIIQSLTDIVDGNSMIKSSINNVVLQTIVERKKQATEWANAAVSSDLSTDSLPSHTPITSSDMTPSATSPPKPSPKQKLPSFFRRNRKNSSGINSTDSCTDYQHDSTNGSRPSLSASISLANSLETECRKWFLSYIEKYIDEMKSETGSSDRETVSIMNQLKRVNDWLDTITKKQADSRHYKTKELDTWEVQACGRVRNKIIMFLLNHVTRAALASGASDTLVVES